MPTEKVIKDDSLQG